MSQAPSRHGCKPAGKDGSPLIVPLSSTHLLLFPSVLITLSRYAVARLPGRHLLRMFGLYTFHLRLRLSHVSFFLARRRAHVRRLFQARCHLIVHGHHQHVSIPCNSKAAHHQLLRCHCALFDIERCTRLVRMHIAW
ncbi:hypothetical protein FA95DRAFT_92755 [Auriscalpium vulgare]|uniref:Uncharacterized protein n=1 Tax=Auriscalpium vulgare TaxID=40419 RepID=A0ACB8RQ19_9AGAM|nr:hypothetical protein FA95DRAFT_92755 [Auriscalpium vulgare]